MDTDASLTSTKPNKPHAVCIPYPAQGHISPMLKLAKILHFKGFHISFVNSDFNHKRLLKSRGPDSLKGLPTFQFYSIPDGLPPSDLDATQAIPALCISTNKTCVVPFRNLIAKINANESLPHVSCIVSDAIMSFTLQVAQELGIPEVLFWTASFIGFASCLHYPHLIANGFIPLKDENDLTNGYLETPINLIPGVKDMRLRDLPTFIRTTDVNDKMIKFVLGEIERFYKVSALIFNTYDNFELEVLNAIKLEMGLPPIYTVGPLPLLLSQIPEGEVKSIGGNLWKEDLNCVQWLDSKEPNSVLYVNFGSIAVMTPQQMVELAWGFANSKKTFLWIVKSDPSPVRAAIDHHN